MAEKIKIIKQKFVLKKKEFIAPHLIRIHLGSEEIELFKEMPLGGTCKLYFPPLGIRDIHFADFDEKSKKWISPSEKFKPKSRTYTLRNIDTINNTLIVDIANHGLNGPGSRWANEAKIGDTIGVSMKSKNKKLAPKSDWYLLAADLTGLPVISVIAENLPKNAQGKMFIEIPTEEDKHIINTSLEINWIINSAIGRNKDLYKHIKQTQFPKKKEGSRFAYVASESNTVKSIRSFFKDDLEWKKDEFYCVSHWKAGKAEKNALDECHDKVEQIVPVS